MRQVPIYDNAFKANPFPFYDELRAEGPLSRVELASGVRCWLVTSYELVRGMLKDPRLSKDVAFAGPSWHEVHVNRSGATSRPIFEHLLTMDPPRHTQLRKLVSQEFQPAHVERLRLAIEQIVADALDDLEPHFTVDYVAGFANAVPLVVICELLGVPLRDRPRFRRWTEILMSADAHEQELIPMAGAEMRAYLLKLAEELRGGDEGSLFSRLARLRDQGELDDDELAAMGFLLLVAGHETTASLLSTGLLALKQSDGAWERLVAAPAEAPGVVEELLRFCSPIEVATPRFAREDVAAGGETIRAGDTVFLGIAAANRDPAQFPRPHTLELGRDTQGHVAFGLGAHYCLGAGLARIEAALAFTALSRRYPRLEIVDDERTLRWAPGLLLRGLRALHVRLEPAPRPR